VCLVFDVATVFIHFSRTISVTMLESSARHSVHSYLCNTWKAVKSHRLFASPSMVFQW
jgi:hypothetical protein